MLLILCKMLLVISLTQCSFLFQLSELEQRVLEAEGRADEAEDKVSKNCSNIFID